MELFLVFLLLPDVADDGVHILHDEVVQGSFLSFGADDSDEVLGCDEAALAGIEDDENED